MNFQPPEERTPLDEEIYFKTGQQCLFKNPIGSGKTILGWEWSWQDLHGDSIPGNMAEWFMGHKNGELNGEYDAFPQVFFGRSPWSVKATDNRLPRALNKLNQISLTYDLETEFDLSVPNTYSLVIDLWLTSQPTEKNYQDQIEAEVLIIIDTNGPILDGNKFNVNGKEKFVKQDISFDNYIASYQPDAVFQHGTRGYHIYKSYIVGSQNIEQNLEQEANAGSSWDLFTFVVEDINPALAFLIGAEPVATPCTNKSLNNTCSYKETLNVKPFIDYLVQNNQIENNDLYLAAIGLGNKIVEGKGKTFVNELKVSISPNNY